MYSKPTLFLSFLLFSQLAPSSPLPADAQAPLMQEHQSVERSADAQQDDAIKTVQSPQYVINKMEPNTSVTCKASDTACVMGKAGPSSKREAEPGDEIPEYLEGPVDKRQMASNGIQAAISNAGINNLGTPNVSSNPNTTSSSTTPKPTTRVCKGSDTACVVGARDAMPESQAEADFDPIAIRVAELQAELEEIRGKRDQLVKRAPVPAATTTHSSSTSTTTTSSSSTSTITSTATLNTTTSSSTTSTGFPRTTNAFGRVVCKASDTECVTGQS